MSSLSPAEKMDRQYRFQRHIYDATRTHYLRGRSRLIRNLKPPHDGVVVEVACGTGWNLIQAAETYSNARFFGLDISSAMLTTARAKVAGSGLAHRVTVAQGDATDFNLQPLFGVSSADRIFISYALSMIPDWPDAITRGVESLSPAGELHIVDFGRMDRMPGPAKWALRRWLTHYNVT
ncbi:MAG: class I SAM-dependent methyltransferase, partial [Hyphomicrobium sp.]